MSLVTSDAEGIKKFACNKFRTNYHFDYQTGLIRHCCLHTWFEADPVDRPSGRFHEILADMKQGKRNSHCHLCYEREDRGLVSLRSSNPNHVRKFEKAISSDNKNFELDFFEISMSNLCNLQCVYCRPEFSSRWEEEFAGSGSPLKKDMTDSAELEKKRERFWALFKHSDVTNVRLIGGEPFINPDFFPILDRISQHPKNRLRLTISSNLNFSEVHLQKFLDVLPKLLQKFDITLIASMESTGKFAEFIRYGLSWKTFCRNYEKLAEVKLAGFDLGTRITLNVLAAKDLYSYLEYLVTVNAPSPVKKSFECGNLIYPGYLQVALLPMELRGGLKRCLQLKEKLMGVFDAEGIRFLETSLQQAISEPYVYRQNEVQELSRFLSERKKHWGMDFVQLDPEFSEVLRTR